MVKFNLIKANIFLDCYLNDKDYFGLKHLMELNECINKNGGIIIGQTNGNGNDKPNCDSGDDGEGLPLNNNNNNNKKDDSCTELDHANRISVNRKVVYQTNVNSMVNSDSTATDIAEMSLMQDSSSELQWCTELDYHYQR